MGLIGAAQKSVYCNKNANINVVYTSLINGSWTVFIIIILLRNPAHVKNNERQFQYHPKHILQALQIYVNSSYYFGLGLHWMIVRNAPVHLVLSQNVSLFYLLHTSTDRWAKILIYFKISKGVSLSFSYFNVRIWFESFCGGGVIF